MPYIVTTHRYLDDPTAEFREGTVTRTAVATLEEARTTAYSVVNEHMDPGEARVEPQVEALSLPESGGTVGPLPDGTVIEVTRVDGMTLRGLAQAPAVWTEAEAIATFNAS